MSFFHTYPHVEVCFIVPTLFSTFFSLLINFQIPSLLLFFFLFYPSIFTPSTPFFFFFFLFNGDGFILRQRNKTTCFLSFPQQCNSIREIATGLQGMLFSFFFAFTFYSLTCVPFFLQHLLPRPSRHGPLYSFAHNSLSLVFFCSFSFSSPKRCCECMRTSTGRDLFLGAGYQNKPKNDNRKHLLLCVIFRAQPSTIKTNR